MDPLPILEGFCLTKSISPLSDFVMALCQKLTVILLLKSPQILTPSRDEPKEEAQHHPPLLWPESNQNEELSTSSPFFDLLIALLNEPFNTAHFGFLARYHNI